MKPRYCPSGHKVEAGKPCTVVYCIEDPAIEKRQKAAKREQKKRGEKPVTKADMVHVPPEMEGQVENPVVFNELLTLQNEALRDKIHKVEKAPNEDGEGAEKWADGKLTRLLPKAVQHLERMLAYGTSKQKDDAAKQILESTGRGKRDGGGGTGPSVILQITGKDVNVATPWRQKSTAAEVVVEGEKK